MHVNGTIRHVSLTIWIRDCCRDCLAAVQNHQFRVIFGRPGIWEVLTVSVAQKRAGEDGLQGIVATATVHLSAWSAFRLNRQITVDLPISFGN